jgi:hypothetical protein
MRGRDEDDFDGMGGGMSQGRSAFGGTSSFSTTGLSKDGRFLGIALSENLASDFRKFYPMVLGWVRRAGQRLGVPVAEKFAESVLNKKGPAVQKFGNTAGNVIGYSIILSNQILDIGSNIYDSTKSINGLRQAVQPLAKVGGAASTVSPLSGDNEVVSNARKKINGIFWQRLLGTATGAIAIAPELYFMWNEQKAANANFEKKRALEKAKGKPEELANLWDKEISLGGVKTTGTAEEMRAAREILINRHRTEYETELTKLVTEGKATKAKELEKALTSLDKRKLKLDAIEHTVESLGEKGFNVSSLTNTIDSIREHHIGGEANNRIAAAIEQFKVSSKAGINNIAESAIKREYVQTHGAFDGRYTKYLSDDQRNAFRHGEGETLQGKLETELHEAQERMRDASKDDDKKDNSEVGKMAASLASGFAAEFTTQKIIGKSLDKYAQPIAIDRILHLRRVLEEAGDNPPELVPGIQLDKQRGENDTSYVRYVHDIFEQHQRDSGRPDIGERFFEHFEAARWDDKAIQEMPDEQLTAYEYAVKTIAKRIKDGRMDAIALVNLVGDKEKKIVRNDGRSFGPKGIGKDEAVAREAILHIVDEQTAIAHAGQKKSDGDINEKLGNFLFSVDDLKKVLNSDTLDKQQRAFVFTIFSDAVGNEKELCKLLGITDQRCNELRKETKDTFNATLDGAVLALADALQSDPEFEKKLKLTSKEKDVILSLADRISEEGKDVADLTADRQELKTLETVVANAVMKGKDGLWSHMVEKAKSVPQLIADAKKRREEAASTTMAEQHSTAEEGPTPLMDRATREEPVVPGGRGA